MTLLLDLLIAPAIEQVADRGGIFRKPSIRLGPLYLTVCNFAFQQGGVLGSSLRDQPVILGKFLGLDPNDSVRLLTIAKDDAGSTLNRFQSGSESFSELYAYAALRELGIEPVSLPPDRRLEEKLDDSIASSVISKAWGSGCAFGFHHPEAFEKCWGSTYAPVPVEEWEQMREAGLLLSESQEEKPLDAAVVEMLSVAMQLVESSPSLIDGAEAAVLKDAIYGAQQRLSSGD